MSKTPHPQLFTDANEFLIAAVDDEKLKRFRGYIRFEDSTIDVYGLARSEHQFNVECARRFVTTEKMDKDAWKELIRKVAMDRQEEARAELAGGAE